jgi:cell division protease FtsH
MKPLPSVAQFAAFLADLAVDLHRGNCCLVTADKAWTHLLFYHDLRDRLSALGLRCEYIDGRRPPADNWPDDAGVMLTAIGQLRRAVRQPAKGVVIVLPYLDVMASAEGGWTSIAREVAPLLYEDPEAVVLGFRDPTLSLLPIVEKVFLKRHTLEQPFGGARPPERVEGADATPPPECLEASAPDAEPGAAPGRPRD